jgi:hypothetical protein
MASFRAVLRAVSDSREGGAERVAANLLRTCDLEQFDMGTSCLRGPFGSDYSGGRNG